MIHSREGSALIVTVTGVLGRSGERRERSQPPKRDDEGRRVGAGVPKTQVELSRSRRDPSGNVEEAQSEPLAPTGPERLGEAENSHPARHVVGESCANPPAPVAEEALERNVAETEVLLQLADRFFWRPTAQAMVVLDGGKVAEDRRDVRDNGVEAPAVEVVEGEVLAGACLLAAHDHAQVPAGGTVGALGEFRATELAIGVLCRHPGRLSVLRERVDRATSQVEEHFPRQSHGRYQRVLQNQG